MGGSYSVPEQFYYAAKEGSAQKLRQLEQRHAPDVAWTNLDGSSAVHMAAASLDAETVRCVVSELGGDAGLRNAKSELRARPGSLRRTFADMDITQTRKQSKAQIKIAQSSLPYVNV